MKFSGQRTAVIERRFDEAMYNIVENHARQVSSAALALWRIPKTKTTKALEHVKASPG